MPDQPPPSPPKPITGRQAYNLVTDTVAGPNIRLKDNLYQALAIFISTILGALIALFFITDKIAALFVGAFIGLITGLFASGIFLMIYRALKHSSQKHD